MSGLSQPGPAAYQQREPEGVKPGAVRVSGRGKKHTPYQGSVIKGGPRGARAHPIFRTTKRSAFSTDAQSRFASAVLVGVLRLLCPAQYI